MQSKWEPLANQHAKQLKKCKNTKMQNIDNYGYTMEFAISGAMLSIGGLSDVTDGDADKFTI